MSLSDPVLIDLALQGGGSHGAFTWGVLDRLLEESRLRIAGISGTSAGAMNAAVLADGWTKEGAEGARAALDQFWQRVSRAAAETRSAHASFSDSHAVLLLTGGIAILLGVGVMALLIGAVVPRVRRYSHFARRVAAGDADRRVPVTGRDEITELGAALNEMVDRRIVERAHDDAQAEFAELMQLTETRDEAHHLLKRHIERQVPESTVVVLNRNNSTDRLQPTTAILEGSPLSVTLKDATARSCLAVRFARTHTELSDGNPLVVCEVCRTAAACSTCEPLLVGGEVIGSVLAMQPRVASEADAQSIKSSVTQAAPVLANLRNLAIAERNAKTDALTGLANSRNVSDTVKRMVAHASRTVAPLAALALDLDHFKAINDTYGHGTGDDVLAALGSVLNANCRDSDFVGRVGGEEFLILLPDTSLHGAQRVAETLRAAVASIRVSPIDHAITASIGVAALPDHAGDAAMLLSSADRALYAAKRNGRNRVATFTLDTADGRRTHNGTPGGSLDIEGIGRRGDKEP